MPNEFRADIKESFLADIVLTCQLPYLAPQSYGACLLPFALRHYI